MKRKKYHPIKLTKQRVVLSDILPFETPVTFTNRHFYEFLYTEKIALDEDKLLVGNPDRTLEQVIRLLFDIGDPNKVVSDGAFNNLDLLSIPFTYKIAHKENDFRHLSIIHPKNQLAVSCFYNKFKDLIVYYCNISPYSIRYPAKIAKCYYFKDSTHYNKLSRDVDFESIERNDAEYESLKTYFVYKSFNNIHKFYESYKYHRCEKKYKAMFKFDVSKCFDSIYSHTISWAILNKDSIKNNLGTDKNTFGYKFDKLLQSLNYNETNGIVIGPEFSRIFAEIILQKVDRMVYDHLREQEIFHKKHYEIFRYVDDFFVFYNDEEIKEKILKQFRLCLKEFKLYLNDAKSVPYTKPIITEITIAKGQIVELLSNYIKYTLESIKEGEENKGEMDGELYVSSNRLITKFKTILKVSMTDYKDVLNFTLAVIYKKVLKVLLDFTTITEKRAKEKKFTKAILEILDFVFFLYAVSPRVNTTIKLSKVLSLLIDFFQAKKMLNRDFTHLIFKKIYDNIRLILDQTKYNEHTQLETLYLLLVLKNMGKEYWLDNSSLCAYFDMKEDDDGELQFRGHLNYFSITVLLFYIGNKKRFIGIKNKLTKYILTRFKVHDLSRNRRDAELTLLLFDILTCPYLDRGFKKEMLKIYKIDSSLHDAIIDYRREWFTSWENFSLRKELDAKLGQEVY